MDNIDKFISKVKRLARQLRFREHSILIKLKQLFPEKANTWLVVHNLDEMCGYLKRLYSPYNLKQNDQAQGVALTSQASASMPFTASTMQQDQYHLKIHQDKAVHFDEPTLLSDKLDMLCNTLNHLADSAENNDRGRPRHPLKPYKPYIMKGRQHSFNCSWSQEHEQHEQHSPCW